MKTKLFILPLLALAVGACQKPAPEEKEHVHHYDTENIEWAWMELADGGYSAKAIFSCDSCDVNVEGHEVVVDATVTNEATVPATCVTDGTIRYTANAVFEGQTYSAFKEKGYSDPEAHHFVETQDEAYLKSPADCEHDAVYYKNCEHCHELSEETFTVPNTKLGHSLVHHEEKGSTCQEFGNIEYWQCSRCEKYFLDENATQETTYDDVKIPLSHHMTFHQGHPATCDEEGERDYYTCEFEEGVLYKNEEGTEKYNDASELVIPRLSHEFDENNECVHCHKTVKEALDLDDASKIDTIGSTTISDMGLTSGATIPDQATAQHLFGNYDFSGKKAMDLWFKMNWNDRNASKWTYIYLFNGRDEDGLVIRIDSRNEDDGIVYCYVFTKNSNMGSATTCARAEDASAETYFPRSSGLKSTTDNVFHITAECINETNNTYRVYITGGVNGGTQWYLNADPEATVNTPSYYDIELGANYFSGSIVKNFVRFSSNGADRVTIADYSPNESVLVYQDTNGNAIGKKSTDTVSLINYQIEGQTLVGWFDDAGNRVKEGDAITDKTVIRPFFTETQDHMFTLSNYGLDSDLTYSNTDTIGEIISPNGVSIESGNRIDVYYTYSLLSISGGDNYFITGVPYDGIDGQSRVMFRINNTPGMGDTRLSGYIYGASLGGAGAEGTRFDSGVHFRESGYETLLIHMTVIDKGNNQITFKVEVTNINDGQVFETSREVTFTPTSEPLGYGLTSEYADRNKFGIPRPIACKATISDVF